MAPGGTVEAPGLQSRSACCSRGQSDLTVSVRDLVAFCLLVGLRTMSARPGRWPLLSSAPSSVRSQGRPSTRPARGIGLSDCARVRRARSSGRSSRGRGRREWPTAAATLVRHARPAQQWPAAPDTAPGSRRGPASAPLPHQEPPLPLIQMRDDSSASS
jgi:hypothetical protein